MVFVVFPPLCLGSVSETAQPLPLEEQQVALITGEDSGYVVKFKVLEWVEELKALAEGH